MAYACIPEGTEIDTPGGPSCIEDLRAGDLVIGYSGKPVSVLQIHGYLEDPHPKRFHRIAFSNGSVVDLCDQHRCTPAIPVRSVRRAREGKKAIP